MNDTTISGVKVQQMDVILQKTVETKHSSHIVRVDADVLLKGRTSTSTLSGTQPLLRKISSSITQQLSSSAALDLLIGELGKLTVTASGSGIKDS